LAAENRLWGAPRIHAELLKLRIAVPGRTASRYLANRLRAPSQTWRTFLANHLGQFTFISPETSPYVPGAVDVGDGFGLTFRQTPLSRDGLCGIVINARSWSVLRFSGRNVASTSFKLTFTPA
jgi:hypothetical protein